MNTGMRDLIVTGVYPFLSYLLLVLYIKLKLASAGYAMHAETTGILTCDLPLLHALSSIEIRPFCGIGTDPHQS